MENHERRQKKEGKERENRRSIESTSNEKPSGDWLTDLLFSLFLCFCLKIFFLFFFSYNIIISDFVLMMEMKVMHFLLSLIDWFPFHFISIRRESDVGRQAAFFYFVFNLLLLLCIYFLIITDNYNSHNHRIAKRRKSSLFFFLFLSVIVFKTN